MTDFSPSTTDTILADRIRKIETTGQPYRFPETYCSQCGRTFGPGDHGFSHCRNHKRGRKAPRGFRHSFYAEQA